ncbi:MAG: bifunctional DNA-formamidopyrimidine glycosylase/DNA-(apurinic or apyrimidinic site) lyase [Myxococcales bacterium]
MPELPEVEFAANRLRQWMLGRLVVRAKAEPTRLLRGMPPGRFAQALSGRRLEGVERRGKYLLLFFDQNAGLLAHLGMTGKLVRRPTGTAEPYSHARFELDDGFTVHFRDPRKFGRLSIERADRLYSLPEIAALGPDALLEPPTAESLGRRLSRTARPVKVALMDQSVIAGLGNIHATEALFRAQIDPRLRADRLTEEQRHRLAQAIGETIALGLAANEEEEITYVEEGAPNPFLVYGKAGEACPRCGHRLASMTQGGRTTHFCPHCQR